MEEMLAKYRSRDGSPPPRPIRLQIPGWSGRDRSHADGSHAQPWHCPPFVEGSTYGHELLYQYRTECRVTRSGGRVIFEGDFSREGWAIGEDGQPLSEGREVKRTPPMSLFADGHYGMAGNYDIEPPEGYVLRTEPHPRFYTDDTGSVPCLVPGHIHRWWSRIFFAVFKAPREGETHVFRPGEPYGQVLFVPQRNPVSFVPFGEDERREREARDDLIERYGPEMASRRWIEVSGLHFNDKYRVLSLAYAKGGYEAVDKIIAEKTKEGREKRKECPAAGKIKIPMRIVRPGKGCPYGAGWMSGAESPPPAPTAEHATRDDPV